MAMQTEIFISYFREGDPVEVIKRNLNFYYPASVIRAPTKQKNPVFVEYLTLSLPSSSPPHEPPKRLRDYVNVANVRPKLPQRLNLWLKVGDSVDAYRETDNAWCPGTITDILENFKYLVAFKGQKNESFVIEQRSLRLHRKWVDGVWVPPIPEKEKPSGMETKPRNVRFKIKYSRKPQRESKFRKGGIVEVSSDEEGYKGAWFVATIVDSIGKESFLVEYRDLTTDDGSHLLKEETDRRHIRPCPPEIADSILFISYTVTY